MIYYDTILYHDHHYDTIFFIWGYIMKFTVIKRNGIIYSLWI